MNPEARERAIRIVKQLLSEADKSGRTRAEIERAAQKAQELIEKYQLENVDFEKKEFRETLNRCQIRSGLKKQDNGEVSILNAIVLGNNCKLIISRINQEVIYNILGFESDVELIKQVFLFVNKKLNELYKQEIIPVNVHGRVYRNSFMLGAAYSISERIKNGFEERKQEYTNTGNALMVIRMDALAEIKKPKVEEFVEKEFPILKSGKESKSKLNFSAYYNGKKAGEKIDLANKIN